MGWMLVGWMLVGWMPAGWMPAGRVLPDHLAAAADVVRGDRLLD
ncbi:hypothetical protein [Nocardia brasiliensis]|nr:hypothetical protein [Nocardia brasiliensis]